MPYEVILVPCLADNPVFANYSFLLHNDETGDTAVFDCAEAAPVKAELTKRGWTLTDIVITHHHWDHIDGIPDLVETYQPRVIGSGADSARLPALSLEVAGGDTFMLCGLEITVFDVPGHADHHLAFHAPEIAHAFTGDSLMVMGCGRLLEGTATQMWNSLQKLRALPDDTMICSSHEYAQGNVNFALSLEPDNAEVVARHEAITQTRAKNLPTVPARLDLEKRTNPFLRADDPVLKSAIGMSESGDLEVFTEIRTRKDNF